MPIPFAQFRKRVILALKKSKARGIKAKNIDRSIALGVLIPAIGAVAEADGKFLPEEDKKIKEILLSYFKISDQDYQIVLAAMRISAMQNVGTYKFAREAGKTLSRETKIVIIEDLLRIACADKKLAKSELDIIKKLSDIFKITKADFSAIVSKIKKKAYN